MSPWLGGLGSCSLDYDVKFDLILIWFDLTIENVEILKCTQARNSRQLPEYFAELLYNPKQYNPKQYQPSPLTHGEIGYL